MKEHILFVIDGLPGGGAENITITLAAGLRDRGFNVSLISLQNKLDYTIPDNVNYVLVSDQYKGPFRKLTELSRRAKQLDVALESIEAQYGKPSLVISSLHKTDRIVIKSKKLTNYNVWHCIHGMLSNSYLANRNKFSYLLKKSKIKRVYDGRNIITVSNAVAKDLKDKFSITPSAIKVIYNPFDIEKIRKLSLENNPFDTENYILHVGRFHSVKRHDRLLDAYHLANIPAKLIILGKGNQKAEEIVTTKIKKLGLDSKVILAGFHSNPLPIIRGAKVTVISSDSEGLPTVLIESLICNTPIVSTNCPGGVSEIMSGSLSCYLSDMNAESLAEKISLAYNNPPVIEDNMIEKFSYDKILDQYISLIK